MYPEYMSEEDEKVLNPSKEAEEAFFLKGIAEKEFAENAQIFVDKVVDIEDAILPENDDAEVEIDDVLEEIDAIEEDQEEIQEPIKSLVRGRITDGDIEITFIALVHEGDEVKVFTGGGSPNSYELREKAAELLEERLVDYLD